jgi:glutaredoxin
MRKSIEFKEGEFPSRWSIMKFFVAKVSFKLGLERNVAYEQVKRSMEEQYREEEQQVKVNRHFPQIKK